MAAMNGSVPMSSATPSAPQPSVLGLWVERAKSALGWVLRSKA